jgi:hypothetical protein
MRLPPGCHRHLGYRRPFDALEQSDDLRLFRAGTRSGWRRVWIESQRQLRECAPQPLCGRLAVLELGDWAAPGSAFQIANSWAFVSALVAMSAADRTRTASSGVTDGDAA